VGQATLFCRRAEPEPSWALYERVAPPLFLLS
jgi:hypothetical protein